MLFNKFSFLFVVLLLSSSRSYSQEGLSLEDYGPKLGKFTATKVKIEDIKIEMRELIKSKKAERNIEQKHEIMEQIVERYKELNLLVKEYNELRLDLKYRFPEKDDSSKRKYMPIKAQTIEEIEKETDLDGLLSRLKEKVDNKYRTFMINAQSNEEIAKATVVDILKEQEAKGKEIKKESKLKRLTLEK